MSLQSLFPSLHFEITTVRKAIWNQIYEVDDEIRQNKGTKQESAICDYRKTLIEVNENLNSFLENANIFRDNIIVGDDFMKMKLVEFEIEAWKLSVKGKNLAMKKMSHRLFFKKLKETLDESCSLAEIVKKLGEEVNKEKFNMPRYGEIFGCTLDVGFRVTKIEYAVAELLKSIDGAILKLQKMTSQVLVEIISRIQYLYLHDRIE